jgi:hypothetical protein
MEGDPSMSSGGYLEVRTGEVYDDSATDPMMVGEDVAIDVEQEPARWLGFDRTGSQTGWRDMAAFAERQRDVALRERLERAIEGKGAFGRFRDLVHEENLATVVHLLRRPAAGSCTPVPRRPRHPRGLNVPGESTRRGGDPDAGLRG